jgi:hypothetical protein
MTAAFVEVKQKLTSNFDQSISESINDGLTRDKPIGNNAGEPVMAEVPNTACIHFATPARPCGSRRI